MLSESGYQVYLKVECGHGKSSILCLSAVLLLILPRHLGGRRRKDQSSNSSPIPTVQQPQRQLVLPLWLHVTIRQEECPQMLRVFSYMPRGMCSPGSRLLRHDDGDGKHLVDSIARHQDYSGSSKTRTKNAAFTARVNSCSFDSSYACRTGVLSASADPVPVFAGSHRQAASRNVQCASSGRPAIRCSSSSSQRGSTAG